MIAQLGNHEGYRLWYRFNPSAFSSYIRSLTRLVLSVEPESLKCFKLRAVDATHPEVTHRLHELDRGIQLLVQDG